MEFYEFVQIFYLCCDSPNKSKGQFLRDLLSHFIATDEDGYGEVDELLNLSDNSMAKLFSGKDQLSQKRALIIINNSDIDKFAAYAEAIKPDDIKIKMENKFREKLPDYFDPNRSDYVFGVLCGQLLFDILCQIVSPEKRQKGLENNCRFPHQFYSVYKSSQISESEMNLIMSGEILVKEMFDITKTEEIELGRIYRIYTTVDLKSHFIRTDSFVEATFQCIGQRYSSLTSFDNWVSKSQINNFLNAGAAKLMAWIRFTSSGDGKMILNILTLGEKVSE